MKSKQTFFNVTKGQVSNFLRMVEYSSVTGKNYCYAMQNAYSQEPWFVVCDYADSNVVFAYCAFGYWLLKEDYGYVRATREEVLDRVWNIIQEDY